MENNKESFNLSKKWELINFCEFDQYAVKSYCAIHDTDESLNLGDITKVDETKLKPFNMICGGSPCQDFSVAGKQKGSMWTCKDCGHEYNPLTVRWSKRDGCPHCNSKNIEKTRSSLLVEYLRVIRANKPNFGMYENVKNIVGKQFRNTTFKLFEDELHEYGYNTYWKVSNSKNYGVPQNRERVILIFIKKELDNGKFVFPEGFDNGIRLKDVLEDKVDEKYYISDNKVQKFFENLSLNKYEDDTNLPRFIGNINRSDFGTGYAGGVWDANNISPTLTTMQGGGRQPHIITSLLSNKGEKFKKEIEFANTLLARDYKGFGNQAMNGVIESYEQCLRIRKLTPKECFRLMGFNDKDYYAAKTGSREIAQEILDKYPYQGKRQMDEAERISRMSNSQLYKQAGNSIVVDVLYYILVELYKAMPYLFDNLKLSSFFSGIGAFECALNRLYESINTGNFTKPQVE